MPHYAAALKGEKHVLEDIAPCFNTALSTIRRRGDEWVLESSNFERCQSVEEVYTVANALLRQIHQVLALYLELPSAPSLGVPTAPFSISSIMVFDGDILVRRRIYSVMNMWLYGATKTLYPTASGSLATAALSLADSDHAVREALSLVGSGEPSWSRIYDIIEFLGGPRLIAEAGLASKKKTACVKQTANHYRHLGNPQNATLPSNPPTLRVANLFALDLLQKWIAQKTCDTANGT
jgi:hypothetical protein